MKKRNAGIFLLGGLLFFGFGVAQAQNNGAGSRGGQLLNLTDEEKATKKEEIKAKKEDRWETVTCKKIETRTRERYQKYETSKAVHKQIYDKMNTKVETIIDKLKTDGQDVSVLKADLAQLETKLQKLYADHAALIQKMKEIETGVCASNKEDIGNKIKEIKQYRLETIKVDVADIRTFYSTVLRPDLVASIQKVKATTSPSATPSAE